MDSHLRVYIDANWQALRCLPGLAYKVLMCLVARADSLGRCFPSLDRIAEDTDSHRPSVITALEQLQNGRYIGYLRRDEHDLVTGRQLPNVYLVSPHFLCIALECQNEALNLWSKICDFEGKSESSEMTLTSSNNQHQKTTTIESTTKTSSSNQRTFEKGGAGDAAKMVESPGEKSKKQKSRKAKSQDESTDGESQQAEGRQRSEKHRRSAAGYAQPSTIGEPLADVLAEDMAARVNRLGVPMVQARGFVVSYGADKVEKALLMLAAAKRRGRQFDNDGGFFRYLLQNNLIDSNPSDSLSAQDSSWAEYSG